MSEGFEADSPAKLLSVVLGAVPIGLLSYAMLTDLVLPDAPEALRGAIAIVVAIVLVEIGSLWDNILFDGLYSTQVGDSERPWLFSRQLPNGRWEGRLVHRERLPLLPPGAELNEARTRSRRPYKQAKAVVEADGRWPEIRGRVELSKFCRALIVPFAAVAGIAFAHGDDWATWGVALALAAPCALLAYLHARVSYMTALYDMASVDPCVSC